MAKMRKSQLKEIVKECLVEILSEGLASNSQAAARLTSRTSSKKVNEGLTHSKKSATRRKTALDSISYGESPRLDSAIENSVSTLTSDPIMQSIFNDTARTTLQEQLANESHSAGPALQTASDSAS
jgi:ribosomal protein S20